MSSAHDTGNDDRSVWRELEDLFSPSISLFQDCRLPVTYRLTFTRRFRLGQMGFVWDRVRAGIHLKRAWGGGVGRETVVEPTHCGGRPNS